MGIYSAVNSLQWAMPQAKHIQMDSDLLETRTLVFFSSPRPHCLNCPLWRQSVNSLGKREPVVSKILSFFEIADLKFTVTKTWKLGTWHTGSPSCGFADIIMHMVKNMGPPRSVALGIFKTVKVLVNTELTKNVQKIFNVQQCLFIPFVFFLRIKGTCRHCSGNVQ